MKKLLLFFVFFAFSAQANAGNFIYPFDQVANPKCRFSSWNTLGSDCKITLPRIDGADYTKYKDNATMRRIYTILWGATYNYGWDVGFGSHGGIDIATSLGTPVRSIGDGEVVTSGWLNGWGNTVVVKHKLPDGRYVYSNYSHMSRIDAKKGPIKAGESIGAVGATGNSYGNHLHFQIDIANTAHPYWYTTCSKGIDIMTLVNDGKCRDLLLKNAIDPILFLESNGSFVSVNDIQTKQNQTKKIDQKNIKSREQIQEEEIQEFLKNHTFELKTGVTGDNLEVGKTYITKLNVYENGKPFNGSLPGNGIVFEADKNSAKFFPESVIAIENGSREIMITGLSTTKQTVVMKLGKSNIGSAIINFYKPSDLSEPTDASITPKSESIMIGEEQAGAVVFRTKFGSQQIFIPYSGTYKLRATNGKVKFCNVSLRKDRKCFPLEMASELEFRYADTENGILLFNMVAYDYAPIKLSLIKVGGKNEIAWTKKQILVSNPNNLDPSYAYFNENINTLKKGYFKLNNGYLSQDRELLSFQLKDMLINYYSYEYLKSGDNLIRKEKVLSKIRKWQQVMNNIDNNKTITRGELSRTLLEQFALDASPDKIHDPILNDEKGPYKDYMMSLRVRYGFRWKDQFATAYFQPDKKVTIGEALYLLESLSSYVQI